MRPDTGIYIIRPKGSTGDALIIGPVNLPYPLRDVPVKIADRPMERWLVRDAENNTVNVFAGRGNPNDYKWIVNDNKDLFVSAVSPPGNFRFESAGNNLFTIGIPNEDLLLTANRDVVPQLSFEPANGSDEQRFEIIRIDRE